MQRACPLSPHIMDASGMFSHLGFRAQGLQGRLRFRVTIDYADHSISGRQGDQ